MLFLKVILMDATVATGAAAMMAIRVLLDHDVPERNINLVSLLMAESGTALQACSNPEMLESRIPSRCDNCRQCGHIC